MKILLPILLISVVLAGCSSKNDRTPLSNTMKNDSLLLSEEAPPEDTGPPEIRIAKELGYDQHTLQDTFPYKDTIRIFQWKKIKDRLSYLETLRRTSGRWGILQNYRNKNGEAPVVRNYKRNEYKRVSDSLGIERYQSVPLYLPNDSTIPERYGRDGSLVKLLNNNEDFIKVSLLDSSGEWMIPSRYVRIIPDSIAADSMFLSTAVFVDRTNQNIASLEKAGSQWLIRSMNPATTGLHNPPYMHETPLGMFMIQEKKPKMIFLKDGSQVTGGFAPYASRFTNGGYIHGVPVNAPRTSLIEFSSSLGTTPRSHMCVRNATSHAKFIYDWSGTEQTPVFVFD